MTYKIQKWNVKSPEVRPILVANARVDWMALQDSELTQQFEILREGILRRYCYQVVAQLTNGWISCNHSVSFGRL